MTTQFENGDTFENASVMLEVCREAFERGGFKEEARQLRGLEATSQSTAYASLLTLMRVKPRSGETKSAKKFAIDALRLLVSSTPSDLPLTG